MGGFEGGDEAGFWDEDRLTLLIKEQKKRSAIHKEHFYRLHSDASYSAKGNENIYFVPCECDSFCVEAPESAKESVRSISKAFELLDGATLDTELMDFFSEYKIVLKGVKSSCGRVAEDTAAFLLLTKEICNLLMHPDELLDVAKSIDDAVANSLLAYQNKEN